MALQRRQVLALMTASINLPLPLPAGADGSGPQLASYYDRHMALVGGVAYVWVGHTQPVRVMPGLRQVGVSETACFALTDDGRLLTWADAPAKAVVLMHGVAAFASGQSGWMAIDHAQVLWQARSSEAAPRRVAADVVACCVGDSADYHVRRDGSLWVQGLAHRGQYGDGRLSATPDYVQTATDAVAVKAHTGHALYLSRQGTVYGTGGNRFGPLGQHGLGDKADRWGAIFEGARAIATGSRHSLALRADDSLWAWGEGFGTTPRVVAQGIRAVAAGNTATLALRGDGALMQWEGSSGPRQWVLA